MYCRICKTLSTVFFEDSRTFYRCPDCSLIFTEQITDKPTADRLYREQWENSAPDHWRQLADGLEWLVQRYCQPQKILDFGSGSGELTKEFQRRGFDITPLDPMTHGYLKDQSYSHKFDVVLGVEVIEHLPNLREELHEIHKVLTDNGIMLFMTVLTNEFINLTSATEVFKAWWYKDDPTHVSFFSDRSIFMLAEILGCRASIHGQTCFVLRKLDRH